jgi:hypothetical protein
VKTSKITVTTSPTLLVGAIAMYREIHIHNESGNIYIGNANVTTETGVKVDNNTHDIMHLSPNETMYAVTASGTANVWILELGVGQ